MTNDCLIWLFVKRIIRIIDSLTQDKLLKLYLGIEHSYFGLSTHKDYLVYEKKRYKIAKTSYLFTHHLQT